MGREARGTRDAQGAQRMLGARAAAGHRGVRRRGTSGEWKPGSSSPVEKVIAGGAGRAGGGWISLQQHKGHQLVQA